MDQHVPARIDNSTPEPPTSIVTHVAAWRWFFGLGLVATIGYFLLPSPAAQNLWYAAFSLLTVFALLAGVQWQRPVHTLPWILLAGGMLLSFGGDAIWAMYENVLQIEAPFPSSADAIYLSGYVLTLAGLVAMTRYRLSGDRTGSRLDAWIVMIGTGLVIWTFLMDPYAHDATLPLLDRLVSMAYPFMDLLMLGAVARLWFAGGSRPRAFVLLTAGFGILLVSDLSYMAGLLAETYATGSVIDGGWLLSNTLLGMAALHPSMRTLCEPGPRQRVQLTWPRLWILTGAALLTPATLGFQTWRGSHIDMEVVVGVSVLLIVLVLLRVGGLLRELTASVHENEQATARERTLRMELEGTNTRLMSELKERERAEQAMRASEDRFRQLFEHSPDSIVLVDPHDAEVPWRIVDCNASACALNGYTRDEMLTMSTHQLDPDDADRLPDSDFLQHMRETGPVHGVDEHRRKDGSIVPVEYAATLITIDGREMMLGIDRDISERKRVETALQTAHDAALEAVRLKSEFLATMSHEIRTPMNGVIGMTEMLLDTSLTPAQREYASVVRDSGNALLTLINEILDFSKIEAGKLELDTVEFEPRQLVESVAGVLLPKVHEKELLLQTSVASQVPAHICGDENRLRQVLLNLLSNAVKFTDAGKVLLRVTVQTETTTHVVLRFAVSDTGIGLSEQARERLFQPFTQADGSTTRKYGGTGLGLAISKRLVDLMGGTINYTSVEGRGSTFWCTVTLERARKQPDQKGFAHQFEPPTLENKAPVVGRAPGDDAQMQLEVQKLRVPSMETPDGYIRILLAEDNRINQKLVLTQLQKLGYQADVAANGHEAVTAIVNGNYSFVLMDCQMPEMDGFAATEAIRQHESETGEHIPIVALTANAMNGDREACLAAGMDDYMTKPVKLDELKRVIEHWHAQATSGTISIP